jgi:thiamine pyrophosphate-dependent acetolactate synthase large subunit-like protein
MSSNPREGRGGIRVTPDESAGHMSGAQHLVGELERLGVELVFGLPGVHNLPIWDALRSSSVRVIGVRHEQTAVYAADGYARATGRLGVAVVTTGPGAANTLAATGEAMASGSPVLVIATDIASTLRRPGVYRGVLHETRDQGAMFAPVTKRARTVPTAQDVAHEVREAAMLALCAPSGAVYLGVPTDFLSARRSQAPSLPDQDRVDPPPLPLDEAAEMLRSSRRPLIWAGGGALRAGAGLAVGDLARRLDAPVLTTYMSRGLLEPEHPCLVPGPVHLPEVGALWDEADLVIAIGTDFDAMMTQNWAMPPPPQMLAINVDDDDAGKNYRPDLMLVGDAAVVTQMLAARAPEGATDWDLPTRLEALRNAVVDTVQREEPHAADLIATMRDTLPDDAIVVADMCVAGYWLGGFHSVPSPRKFAYPVGWGTLGFGFPAGIGAALAGAGRAVVVCGDGGFLFACGELATAIQERVPMTIVLVDDGGYGMLRFDQVHAGEMPFGVDLHTPDFAALAAAFGVPTWTAAGFGHEFARCLKKAMTPPGPTMIIVNAYLNPPPTTSPQWYRLHDAERSA